MSPAVTHDLTTILLLLVFCYHCYLCSLPMLLVCVITVTCACYLRHLGYSPLYLLMLPLSPVCVLLLSIVYVTTVTSVCYHCYLCMLPLLPVYVTGVEAAGMGVDTDKHAATITKGTPGVLHGSFSLLLQDAEGQVIDPHSISAGYLSHTCMHSDCFSCSPSCVLSVCFFLSTVVHDGGGAVVLTVPAVCCVCVLPVHSGQQEREVLGSITHTAMSQCCQSIVQFAQGRYNRISRSPAIICRVLSAASGWWPQHLHHNHRLIVELQPQFTVS